MASGGTEYVTVRGVRVRIFRGRIIWHAVDDEGYKSAAFTRTGVIARAEAWLIRTGR